jgi:DNA-binding NarL/FixJ family response regulator
VLEFTGAHGGDAAFTALSPREREVLALLSDGLDNAQIAAALSISEKTVRNHVSSVYDKLGVWSRAQAVVFAREHGFRAAR